MLHEGLDPLTKHELHILRLLGKCHTNNAIFLFSSSGNIVDYNPPEGPTTSFLYSHYRPGRRRSEGMEMPGAPTSRQ
jgi:hypothetical protein